MSEKDFRERQKVDMDKLDHTNEIVKKLNEQMKTYYPNNSSADERTQTLRSGENVYLSLMMLSQVLYIIHDKSKGIVDASIIMRSKSEQSQNAKENRPERADKKELRDVQACTITIDRVHGSPYFNATFNNRIIRRLYNERKYNLQIMEKTIEFIENVIQDREIPSDLDQPALDEAGKENIKKQCDVIKSNIEQYKKEDSNSITGQEFEIRKYLVVMCTDLLNQRIELRKKDLNERIDELEKQIETEPDLEEKEAIQGFLNYCYKVKENIENLESTNQTHQIGKELRKIFAEDKKLALYTEITQYFEDMNNSEKDNTSNEESNEKKACEYLISILYSLLKLEFKKDKGYQGSNYTKLWSDLHNQLEMYRYCEIQGHKYDNMTFTTISTLLEYLVQLNSTLSDKLQFEIARYQMGYYNILVLAQKCLGEDGYTSEIKNKTNGYLAIHIDFGIFEMKITTHYRDRVMTIGSAAYSNGRDEHMKEKKKTINCLDYSEHKYTPSIGASEQVQKAKNKNSLQSLISNANEEDLRQEEKSKWRKKVFSMIPRYYKISLNKEKGIVNVHIYSEAENIEALFKQTSILAVQKEVEERVKDLIDKGLVSDESINLEVTEKDCTRFFQDTFPGWRNKMDEVLKGTTNSTQNPNQKGNEEK